MESKCLYLQDENGEFRVQYSNLYYIDNKFYFLTLNKEIVLKKVLKHKYEYFIPKILYFSDNKDLENYVSKHRTVDIDTPSCYLSHYYDWNVAHGLYDSLYPIYLLYLIFLGSNNEDKFNIFIELKYIQGWRFNGFASRDWVLDIFKKFCGGKLIKENKNQEENYKFDTFLCGHAFSGISSVNKEFEMPGKNIKALEKFRNRMLEVYDIRSIPRSKEDINILIIESNRYSNEDKIILSKINDELNKNYNSKIISWKNYPEFREQLQIMNNTDILISGAGTSMLNFPFLRDNCILINLGFNELEGSTIPGLVEMNICLLSSYLRVDYYDILEYRKIKYNELNKLIEYNIKNYRDGIHKKTDLPDYIRIWRNYCRLDSENMDIIIERMNGVRQPHLMGYRWPELLVKENYPFNKENNLIKNKLLNTIKMYPKNIFQIYHDKSLIGKGIQDYIINLNPEYSYKLIDFEEGKEIIKANFSLEMSNKICTAMDKIPRYCHKSDLLRYCLLYVYGGAYLDVDLKPLIPFDKIIKDNTDLITCFGSGAEEVTEFKFINSNRILQKIMANGLFISKKGNLLLLDLIDFSINNIHKPDIWNHGNNVRWLYKYLENKCKSTQQQIQPFKNLNIENYSIYLYYEDKRNNNHYMVDENFDIIIDPGDPNYVFSKQS